MNGLRYYNAMSSIKDKKGQTVSWINQLKSTFVAKAKVSLPTPFLMQVAQLEVHVTRKPIKHLHLRLVPPTGVVQVSAPIHLSDERIRAAVLARLDWIKEKQTAFAQRPQASVREYITGETHYYLGSPYRLQVVSGKAKQQIMICGDVLQMHVLAQTTAEKRAALMNTFYRDTLKAMMPDLLAKWQPIMGVRANDWGIKAMKTRWGSCNTRDKRIWMSLMLAKVPPECIEYVLVHELAHLIEANHSPRFHALMTQFLPHWAELKQKLNQSARSELML
jgi:hypothetical protein